MLLKILFCQIKVINNHRLSGLSVKIKIEERYAIRNCEMSNLILFLFCDYYVIDDTIYSPGPGS